jgi:hypothetical protein
MLFGCDHIRMSSLCITTFKISYQLSAISF